MKTKEKSWLIWAVAVAVLDVALPFGIFGGKGSFGGAFSVWLILTAAVVLSGVLYTGSWGIGRR